MHIMCRLIKDKVVIKDNSYCVNLEKKKTLNIHYKKVALERNISSFRNKYLIPTQKHK